MFLKKQILISLMKQSYKKWGLTVGRYDDRLKLEGKGWEVETTFDSAPKDIKAEIVKFCGELPGKEEYATLSPGGSQVSMPVPAIGEPSLKGLHKLFRSNLRIGSSFIMQPEEDGEPLYLLEESFARMAEEGEPDYDKGEFDATGPYLGNDGLIYYWTNTSAARFSPSEILNQHHLMEELREINLMEMDS